MQNYCLVRDMKINTTYFANGAGKKKVTVSDDTLLVYLSEKAKSSTLWSKFLILKSCLAVKENLNVSNLPKNYCISQTTKCWLHLSLIHI